MIDPLQLADHLLAVAGMDIGNYVADLRVRYQKFGYDIDIMAGKHLVDLRQYPRHVGVDMYDAVRILIAGRLQVGEVAAHVRFALVHKGYHSFGDKIYVTRVVFWVIKNNDTILTGRFG